MNRIFRFNVRKSHHRIDSVMGTTLAIRRNIRNSDDTAHQEQAHSPGKKKNKKNGKQVSSPTIQVSKNDSIPTVTSPRLVQSEKSFNVNTQGGDTSETELTIPHVDSSFSQNSSSDTENTAAVTPYTKARITNKSSNDITDSHSCSDNHDYTGREDIPFLGDVFEFVDDDDRASSDDIIDDPIVQIAMQVSKKLLDETCDLRHADFTALVTVTTTPLDEKEKEEFYVKLDQLGNTLVDEGNPEKAVLKYLHALRYKYEALLSMHSTSTRNTMKLRPSAEQRRATEQKQHVLASIATSINNLAFLRHNQSRIDANETLVLYQTALQIKRHVLGSQHLSVGKTLNNIGSIHYIQQEFHLAAQTYEEARTVLQLHLGSHHLDVCTVTSNIGDVHCSLKQWILAAKEYRTALELRWPLYGPSDAKNIRLMEQIAEIEMLINQINAQKEDLEGSSNHDKSYGPIIKDVRKLQKELQRDIDRIDRQLSSELPLQMMKEKTTLSQEIRDIMMSDRKDVCRDDSCDNKTTIHETSIESSIETKNTAKLIEVAIVSESDHIMTPTFNKKVTISPRYTARMTPKKSSSPPLTSDERQRALSSVKEKLAKLRANRESFPPVQMKIITDCQ